ncbi:MAG: NUDIX hydrolase [Ilumatobacteraceae bacterium]|jgi:ADP-ribose pyrophosphatase|nr:NUDIX hydrolase [Ilumatobacteraceae bacterium]
MNFNPMRPWNILSTHHVLNLPPWFSVLRDCIKLPSGRIIDDYYRIESQDYAIVCAQDNDGRVLLERQFKPSVGRFVLTSPAGGIQPNEIPDQAAQRELLEETGYCSSYWQGLGSFVVDGTRGICRAHFFHARSIIKTNDPLDDEMESCELVFLDSMQVRQHIMNENICLLPDIALLALTILADTSSK